MAAPWRSSAAAAPVSLPVPPAWPAAWPPAVGPALGRLPAAAPVHDGPQVLLTQPCPAFSCTAPPPAACGFLGTLVGKRLIQTLGLLRAGAAALLIHACLLGAATVLYCTLLSGPPELGPGGLGGGARQLLMGAGAANWPAPGGVALPVVIFAGELALAHGPHTADCFSVVCCSHSHTPPTASKLLMPPAPVPPRSALPLPALVVMSRIGVWSYDMVNSQLFQQTVAPREIASASSAEMALCR